MSDPEESARESEPGRPRGRATRRTIALWALAGAIGFSLYFALHQRAFPEAQVRVELTRPQAIARAEQVLAELGYDVSAYRRAASFASLENTKYFLERSVPAERATQLMQRDVITWYWFVRFVVPKQEEEFQVSLWPDGRLARFYHHTPDAAAGAALPREESLARAVAFLRDRLQKPLSDYEFKTDSQVTRPQRLDRNFTWTRRNFDVAGAKYEVHVGVSGDAVSTYYERLDIPEESQRAGERHAAHRRLLARVAALFTSILSTASIVVLVLAIRKGSARYRLALYLGLLLGVLNALSWCNSLTGFWIGYDTRDSVATYLGTQLVTIAAQFVLGPVAVLTTFIPADALARAMIPGHVHLSRAVTRPFWQSREVLVAVLVGFCLAFVHAGFVNVFYVLGKPLGVWCPLAQPYTNSLDSMMPWLGAVATGFEPALTEEVLYRMFATALLLRLTKRPLVAVLAPALIWGFNHTLYPQEPIYIRGIELTIVGVMYGLVFLRYGVLATMVSHYTFNALVSGTFLWGSGNPTFQVSGAIVIGLSVLPALPGLLRWARGRRLLQAAEVNRIPYRNKRDATAHEGPPPLPVQEIRYLRLKLHSGRALALLALLGGIGYAVGAYSRAPEGFGDFVRVTVSREQAVQEARAFLEAQGVAVQRYRVVAAFNQAFGGEEADYVWQKQGLAGLERTWRERYGRRVHWYVRFYRPQDPEEYAVYVSVGEPAEVFDYTHTLPDEAKGARLSKDAALALAERYVRARGNIELGQYALVDSGSTERPNRRDHWFVWEDKTERVEEAAFRVSISVQGDEACDINRYLKVPDAWQRARDERRTKDLIVSAGLTVLGLLSIAIFGLLMFILARRHMYVLAAPALLALVGPVVSMLGALNDLPLFWLGYSTATEPAVYAISRVLELFVARPLGEYATNFLALVLGASIYRYAFPGHVPLLAWFGLGGARQYEAAKTIDFRRAWGEALLAGIFVCGVFAGIQSIGNWIDASESTHRDDVTVWDSAPAARDAGAQVGAAPGLEAVSKAIDTGLGAVFAVGFVGGIYARYVRRWWRASLLLIVILLFPAIEHSNTFYDAVVSAIGIAAAVVLAPLCILGMSRFIGRANVALYVCVMVLSTLLPHRGALDRALTPFALADCYVRYAAVALVLVLGLWMRYGGRAQPEEVPPEMPEPAVLAPEEDASAA